MMAKYQVQLEVTRNEACEPIPMGRSGHRCVTDGVFLYSFGGFNPLKVHDKLFSKYLWCFHLNSKKWLRLSTYGDSSGKVPKCVTSSTMLLYRDQLIMFGGSGHPFGTANSNEMFVCKPKDQIWHIIPGNFSRSYAPTPGYGQGCIISPDDKMYIFGGTKGSIYNDNLHMFNMRTYNWVQCRCKNPPSPRYRHEMVNVKDGFLVVGGYGDDGACPLDKVHRYHFSTLSWQEIQCQRDPTNGFPPARRAHTCNRFDNNVYVTGGFQEESSDQIFNDIWKLDLDTFTWSMMHQVSPKDVHWEGFILIAFSDVCVRVYGVLKHMY